ncbi:carboxymuconolactone decarboxylase family protein [Budvicia aquatica]|uniref:carboxymuconolactone decarboxylase family protein n=1 Tax=Budvicia aquatica TaxID=82979 RepID=UPI00208171C3|nr:carboxymuconolactone decarboxylase family protein [Budvicia aquatica]GKX52152.1 alkyl hydroperoxide reductase AhpD [Budvicia aquatica]
MSELRLPYSKLSSEAYAGLGACKAALDKSVLGKPFIELIYLRVSQINGCAFCLDMHSKALRAQGVDQRKLDTLAGWRVSDVFDPRERAALAWAESLTHIDTTGAPDEVYQPLTGLFSEVEISDLTFAVSLMNAFNRLAVGMRQ